MFVIDHLTIGGSALNIVFFGDSKADSQLLLFLGMYKDLLDKGGHVLAKPPLISNVKIY